MNETRLFLKIFAASLLLHIGLLPFFSLVVPARVKSPLPRVYVSLRPLPFSVKPVETVKIAEPEPPLESRSVERLLASAERLNIGGGISKEGLGHEINAGRGGMAVGKGVSVSLSITYVLMSSGDNAGSGGKEFTMALPAPPASPPENGVESDGGISSEITGPGGSRKLAHREIIKYPEWAQKKGIEGNVRIKFWVEPNGAISQTELVMSSGYPELDIMLEQAFRRWLFEPVNARERVWGEITFRLRLQ